MPRLQSIEESFGNSQVNGPVPLRQALKIGPDRHLRHDVPSFRFGVPAIQNLIQVDLRSGEQLTEPAQVWLAYSKDVL